MSVPLMLFALALVACVLVAMAASGLARAPAPALRVVGAAVFGFVAGGAVIWLLVPSEWTLSFSQTLAASVDSRTYGHPVEHYAESLLVVMLGACALGSAVFSGITLLRGHRRRRVARGG